MAKLMTHHDPYHRHAILGAAALAHFLYRFVCFFIMKDIGFSTSLASMLGLGIHAMLHLTSLQFEIPKRRLESKPMIWTEFRTHNFIFAYRHLAATLLGVWAPEFWWKSPGPLSLLLKVVLICFVCKAADIATEKLGSDEKRTTNAMPYPTKTAQNVEQMAKWFYAKSQFAATALAAFGPPFLAFGPILAIEGASFLMTLVRKGIIDSVHYHTIYAFTLFIMGPAMLFAMHFTDPLVNEAVFRAMCTCYISVELRMNYSVNKYAVWIIAILGAAVLQPLIGMFVSLQFAAWIGTVLTLGDTVLNLWKARENERMYGLMKAKQEKEQQRQSQASDSHGTTGAKDAHSTNEQSNSE